VFPSEVPENAVLAFERIHGLRVTVHDMRGTLWPVMAPHRFMHMDPLCQAIKLAGRDAACLDWEVTRLRPRSAEFPEGRLQVCHAGLLEWVVPVHAGLLLEWVLFAGIRIPGRSLSAVANDRPGPPAIRRLPGFAEIKVVEAEEAETVLEHLCQLAARLRIWKLERDEHNPGLRDAPLVHTQPVEASAARRILIHRFIEMNHTKRVRLEDLARDLKLSSTRASHAVRENCGASFQELLARARVRTAMGLLREGELSVVEVALRSGYDDVRQFHRAFRKAAGTSPLQYRKSARS